MSHDPTDLLTVRAEAVGIAPMPWAWAIYRGPPRLLILRSRPEYHERAEAVQAGLKVAGEVARKLRAPVVVEEAPSHGETT
ncbi:MULTISPECIES: hypothetical protein [Bacteria]|jgi:hypothetical protein|uniref:hypothetical protein n=1 Tax=Bacteria TaxID=2 RepID=UPI0037035D6A